MARPIVLGPVFWVFGVFLTLILTFALVFLGMVPWDHIKVLFIVGWGGGMVAILVAGRVGLTREGPFSPLVFVAVVAGFLALMVENVIIGALFGVQSVDPSAGVLVNFLSAMYEETMFLGVDSAAVAGDLPAPARMSVLAAVFVPYHALRYPIEAMMYILLLLMARLTLDSLRVLSNHSDPPFIVHALWNVMATIFGGA